MSIFGKWIQALCDPFNKEQRINILFKKEVEEFEKRFVDLHCTRTVLKVLYLEEAWPHVLQPTAPATFYEIGRSLTEHTVLQLCRFTDTERFSGEHPLSVKRIHLGALEYARDNNISGQLEYEPDMVTPKNRSQRELKKRFRRALAKAYVALKPVFAKIRVHRNARVAHHDYRATFKPEEYLLPDLTFGELNSAVDGIGVFLQTIHSHLWGIGSTYNYPYQDGPEQLVSILEQAMVKQIRPIRRH